MDTLLSLRPVSSENVNDLREIYDIIEIHTRNLSSLDVSMKEYGPILNSIIMSKLTRGIKLDISRQMPAGKWNVIKLMDVFKRELVARERCESFEHLSIHRDHPASPNSRRHRHFIFRDVTGYYVYLLQTKAPIQPLRHNYKYFCKESISKR